MIRDHPGEVRSYLCYWLTGRSTRTLDDAARRLDARLAVAPDDHLAELYLGLVEADLRHDRALGLLERAAEGLAAEKNATGEVYARISVARMQQNRGQLVEAEQALTRGRTAAASAGDPVLVARMDWEDSRQAFMLADYGRSWALASKAASAIRPEAPADLRIGILGSLGASAWSLGRHRDAFVQFEREADLQHAQGNTWGESRARSNMAILGGALLGEGDMSLEEVRRLTQSALDVAVAAGDAWVEGDVRLLMAQDPAIPVSVRREHATWVLNKGGKLERTAEALRRLAALSIEADPNHPAEALAYVERAEAAARESGSPLEVAQSAAARMNRRGQLHPDDLRVVERGVYDIEPAAARAGVLAHVLQPDRARPRGVDRGPRGDRPEAGRNEVPSVVERASVVGRADPDVRRHARLPRGVPGGREAGGDLRRLDDGHERDRRSGAPLGHGRLLPRPRYQRVRRGWIRDAIERNTAYSERVPVKLFLRNIPAQRKR